MFLFAPPPRRFVFVLVLPFLMATQLVSSLSTFEEANLRFQEFRNQDEALKDILHERRKVLEKHDVKAVRLTEEEYLVLYKKAEEAIAKAGIK